MHLRRHLSFFFFFFFFISISNDERGLKNAMGEQLDSNPPRGIVSGVAIVQQLGKYNAIANGGS